MIEHIVLFRAKNDATPIAKQAFIAACRSLLRDIPTIQSGSSGENFSDRSDGYHLALVMRFKDAAGLEIYQKHPAHQTFIAEHVKPLIEKVLAVDYYVD